jgi:hypothetical protein
MIYLCAALALLYLAGLIWLAWEAAHAPLVNGDEE